MSPKNPLTLLIKSRCLFSTPSRMTKTMMMAGWAKHYSTTSVTNRRFKLLVVGGGSGGVAIANRMANKTKRIDPKEIAVIEPSDTHYYQPLWTLVGAGVKSLDETHKPTRQVIIPEIEWIKDKAVKIDPKSQTVRISGGQEIEYDYLVVACGIQLHYDHVKGLPQALTTSGVCSNYSPLHVQKTFASLKSFKGGNAVFTFPNTPIKCAGAPQKILYLADAYFREHKLREKANLIYCTSLPVLFGVKKYADALWEQVKKRDITVNLRHNLIEVLPKERKAIFENLDKPNETLTLKYELLHVTPPMGPVDYLKNAQDELVDSAGYLNLNKETLQHVKYSNIFGIGDCTNLPTSKTAAACAGQLGVLWENLLAVMNNKDMPKKYDGYTSCPLVTDYKHCILAEFDYNLQPLETFPFNQAKPRKFAYYLKKDLIPELYWKLYLNGFWYGPSRFRKLLHLGLKQ